jgi:HSP20 family molecular chaperone IbpA
MSYIQIPYDIYESDKEIVIIMPLGGVEKKSVKVNIKEYKFYVTANRKKIKLRDDLLPLEEQCYWWEIKTVIDLPPTIYFKDIKTLLSLENVLQIIIPKNIEPKDIEVQIQYD